MPKKKSKKSTRSRSLEPKKRRSRSRTRSRSRSNSYIRKIRKSKSPKKSRDKMIRSGNERKLLNDSRSPDVSKSRKRKKKSRSRSWTRDRNETIKEETSKKHRKSPSLRAYKSRSRSRSRSYQKEALHHKNIIKQKRYSKSRSYSSRSRTRSRSRPYSSTDPKQQKWEGQNDESYPIPTVSSNITQISIDNQMNQYQNNQYRIPYSRYNKNSYMQPNYQYQYIQRQYLINRQRSFQNLNQFGQFYSYMNQPQVQTINFCTQNETIQTEENREETIKEETEEENFESSNESEISSECGLNENDLKLTKSEPNSFDDLFPANFSDVYNLINEKDLSENIKKLDGSEKEDILFKYLFKKSLQKNFKKFDLVYSCSDFN